MSKQISDHDKAKQYNQDCKIFLLSLKDAFLCTSQISKINANRDHISKYFDHFNSVIQKRELLLKKDSNEPINKVLTLSTKSIESLYVYYLYFNAFAIYANNIQKIDKCQDFDCLDKEFKIIEEKKIKELKDLITQLGV